MLKVPNKTIMLVCVIILTATIGIAILVLSNRIIEKNSSTTQVDTAPKPPPTTDQPQPTPTPQPSPAPTPELAAPVADFKARITKKPFGIYITPQNSPVQPERFTGYHTGADVEYGDVNNPVAVYSIADGSVKYSGWVSGYGGVVAIQSNISGIPRTIIYGHLDPSSIPSVGTIVTRGQQIASLGQAYSGQTDGERRHLHLAVLASNEMNLRGYVSSQTQLTAWLDPLLLSF